MLKTFYDRRAMHFEKGAAIYRSEKLYDWIFQAASFRKSKRVFIADVMSGVGLVGLGISKRLLKKRIPHLLWFVDLSEKSLSQIPNSPLFKKILCDVRDLKEAARNRRFDVIFVRFGVKDFPEREQRAVLRMFFSLLRSGGRLVLVDMVSPPDAKQFLNRQHALKQTLGGRKRSEGRCNIPTEKEWLDLLEAAGFKTSLFRRFESHVKTVDWFRSNQVDNAGLAKLNKLILGASPSVKKALKIRKENGLVNVTYPSLIICGTK